MIKTDDRVQTQCMCRKCCREFTLHLLAFTARNYQDFENRKSLSWIPFQKLQIYSWAQIGEAELLLPKLRR
jgi:hypothetical protein